VTAAEAQAMIDEASLPLARAGRQVVFAAKRTTRAYTITMSVDGREYASGTGRDEMRAMDALANALRRRAA